jgi:hypothetical protein
MQILHAMTMMVSKRRQLICLVLEISTRNNKRSLVLKIEWGYLFLLVGLNKVGKFCTLIITKVFLMA